MTSEPLANTAVSDSGLDLPGLDGGNPLGFLAALGLLRVLSGVPGLESLSMSWVPAVSGLVPAVHSTPPSSLDQDGLLDALCNQLADDIDKHPVRLLSEHGKAKDDMIVRRRMFLDRVEQSAGGDRTLADWLAALASDFAPPEAINQLQTIRRDYYYGNLTSVIRNTTREHLCRSLFHSWGYADPLDNQSLHLDPSEDRRHAHQWNKPSGDPDRKKSGGMLGANRLALEAIPLFTSLPEGGALRTVGFTGNRSTNTRWTWPIWRVSLSLDAVASLLKLAELQVEILSRQQQNELYERGVTAVFRSNRILVQKTPNFTPARRIA